MAKLVELDYDAIDWNERFIYDENSPSGLIWKQQKHRTGKQAGNLNHTKTSTSWRVTIGKSSYYVHRIIAKMFNLGELSGNEVDHIDRNPLNNIVDNLRVVSNEVNMRNFSKRADNTSGITGVYLHTKSTGLGGWVANWYQLVGDSTKMKSKEFSISKYGYDGAFNKAVAFRADKIEELNLQGAGYTENHGK